MKMRAAWKIWGILLLLLCLGITAAQADSFNLSFSWDADGTELSVRLYQQKKDYVLFLPGCAPADSLTVTLQGRQEIRWKDAVIRSGDTVDLTADIGETVDVTDAGGARIARVRVMRGSDIPALFFTFDQKDLKWTQEAYKHDITGNASVVMLNETGGTECADELTSFHVRGNTTRFGYKRPYQFKLKKKAPLFGMYEAKTWILLANWFDLSLIRNQITLNLCRELGLTGTPDSRQTDVYINGVYNGTYLLVEKIQIKKGRLDLTDMEGALEELNERPLSSYRRKVTWNRNGRSQKWFAFSREPEDITGGFLLEIEKEMQYNKNKENGGFVTQNGMYVNIKEPSQIGPLAAAYISGLVNDFDNALRARDGMNRKTGKRYSDYIDMQSFAAKLIVEELSANFDVNAASQFMYKDSDRVDPLLYAGPGWDYDFTYGNKDNGLHAPLYNDYAYRKSSRSLYHLLLNHEDFSRLTRTVFETEAVPAVEILLGRREPPAGSALQPLAQYIEDIRSSAEMNFTRWPAGIVLQLDPRSGKNFDDAAKYVVSWVEQRFDMMVREWRVQ